MIELEKYFKEFFVLLITILRISILEVQVHYIRKEMI